jgi:hypothetical protein
VDSLNRQVEDLEACKMGFIERRDPFPLYQREDGRWGTADVVHFATTSEVGNNAVLVPRCACNVRAADMLVLNTNRIILADPPLMLTP